MRNEIRSIWSRISQKEWFDTSITAVSNWCFSRSSPSFLQHSRYFYSSNTTNITNGMYVQRTHSRFRFAPVIVSCTAIWFICPWINVSAERWTDSLFHPMIPRKSGWSYKRNLFSFLSFYERVFLWVNTRENTASKLITTLKIQCSLHNRSILSSRTWIILNYK